MTNAVIGSLAQDQSDYNLVQASKEVTVDILNNSFFKEFKKYGILNTSASKLIGDTAYFYNLNRINSTGLSEADDSYSNAQDKVFGQRTLVMDALKHTEKVVKKNTMTQIRANTSVGDLDNNTRDLMAQWGRGVMIAGMFIQGAGSVQDSYTRYELSDVPFSGDKARHVTGLNPVEAVSSAYTFYGNNNAGAPADPTAITPSNYATLVDYMNIESQLFDVYQGQTSFNGFDSDKGCRALVVIARSNWNQMLIESPAQGNIPSVTRSMYEQMSAKGYDKGSMNGEYIGGFPVYVSAFTPSLKYLVLDDHFLPRASHNGAEVDNTRVSLILGKGAFDMKVGSMLPQVGNENAAFRIDYDDAHEKLNNFDYYKLDMKFAIKRTVFDGTGVNAGQRFDNATAVLNLYSAK